MKILSCLLAFLLTVVLPAPLFANPKIVVAIQPLGAFDARIIAEVRLGILDMYNVEVMVLPEKEMPTAAYYEPRHRYRAERVLSFLDKAVDGKSTKILGLTTQDISTTKGEQYRDWGVLGLGELGGQACVVSTYRMGKGNMPEALFLHRLIKVINHELGHTFGLDHCPHKGCLMRDANGSIKTVDSGPGAFCSECSKRLKGLVKESGHSD